MMSLINTQKYYFYESENLVPWEYFLGCLKPCLATLLNVQTLFMQKLVLSSPKYLPFNGFGGSCITSLDNFLP